ncbi:hypothetical protein LTR94_004909 [Friedmanniomyces endolithicus]|nr:hypothetical protein LTR94_004909 [Friedmanniomyces endolithicus]
MGGTYRDCFGFCDALAGCVAFSFAGSDTGGTCYLKSAALNGAPSGNVNAAKLVSGGSPSADLGSLYDRRDELIDALQLGKQLCLSLEAFAGLYHDRDLHQQHKCSTAVFDELLGEVFDIFCGEQLEDKLAASAGLYHYYRSKQQLKLGIAVFNKLVDIFCGKQLQDDLAASAGLHDYCSGQQHNFGGAVDQLVDIFCGDEQLYNDLAASAGLYDNGGSHG